MGNWEESLEIAKKHLKIADHMAYVTFSLLKENRLIIKILVELAEATTNLIKAFLYYEYEWKRVNLYHDAVRNLKTFQEKIAPHYMNKEGFETLIKTLEIAKKHKEAPLEFVKKDKFVILIGDKYETLTIELMKEFLENFKQIMKNFPENQ